MICARIVISAALFAAFSGAVHAEPKSIAGLDEFSEKVVAGGPKDFTTVRHVRLRGTNRAIGHKLAEIAATRHGTTADPGNEENLKARWDFYQSKYPTQYQRALGASDYFGKKPEDSFDTLTLGVDMNLVPGCSVVYYPPKATEMGHGILSRNYDFTTGPYSQLIGLPAPPGAAAMYANIYILEMYPEEGIPSLYMCANELLGGCMDGINAAGLSIALLANPDSRAQSSISPTIRMLPGLDEIEVPRFVLERCSTVEEAKKLLDVMKIYYTLIPCHYIIGDRTGNSVVYEYSMNCAKRYKVDGGGEMQVVTNHPVHRMKSGRDDLLTGAFGNSQMRFDRLINEFDNAGPKMSLDEIKHANACVAVRSPAPTTEGGRKPERTLWHSIYDSHDRSMSVDFYLGEGKSPDYKDQRRSGYVTLRMSDTDRTNERTALRE